MLIARSGSDAAGGGGEAARRLAKYSTRALALASNEARAPSALSSAGCAIPSSIDVAIAAAARRRISWACVCEITKRRGMPLAMGHGLWYNSR